TGIAFCILIFLFIKDEKSFDRFHVNADKIYRVEEKAYDLWERDSEGEFRYSAYLQTGLAPAILEEVPQVAHVTRFNASGPGGNAIFTYEDKVFTENLTFTDPAFFQMFTFPLLAGNRDNLLKDKHDLVLTPKLAEKYFGSVEEAMGKTIKVDYWGEEQYTIVGIISEPPSNSSLQFQALVSQENRAFYDRNMEQWGNFSTPTFVQLKQNADVTALHSNLQKLVEKYMSASINRWKERYDPPEGVTLFEYQIKNLKDIHLDTQISWARSSDPKYSYILGGIAILILVIACINYVSLSLTTSASRKTEVGVRKAIGAHRNQLINQFGLESILLALGSMIIGLLLVALFLSSFNEFTNKEITISALTWLQLFGLGTALSLLVGVLAGCYPALFLSAFKPTQVLKGGFTTKLKAGFTKPLVVLQFSLSAFLIISSVIMYKQMEFITTKDLGYNQDQVLVVPTQMGWNAESNKAVERMRNRLSQETYVSEVGGVSLSFNQGWSRNGYVIDGENKAAYVYTIDPYYIPTLDIELVSGRNFDPEVLSDSSAIIVNEALIADMGWDTAQEYLNWEEDSVGQGARIIGVAKDYHFLSLEREIEPMILTMKHGYLTNMLIKLNAGNLAESVDRIKGVWNELSPEKPFDHTFLDEDVQKQYASYERWVSIMGLSTLFAILISCLGLFGLAGINAINRTKEIGIRKVFGAELSNIFLLLNRQYVWLAVIAFAIAAPISWYVMQNWLADFEYGISITWQLFVICMLAGLVIALATVSYHAIRTAFINPADTLKYE
ncbi:ABC transporter permease, partial [Fulvivirga sp. RKSG066]|uniref:ABC transporter permease n=1 Tax=Fulvivirga aurantia TaxID=2529383 RepID=UPI0012BCDE31